MEPTLPVWSIRPNWKGGILERLEWLTDVLTSSSGAEQRRSLRLSPRRSLEVTINPTQNERSFVDLLLHRLGSSDWLFPIWFDKARLAASVEAGDERITFDNTYREHGVGGLAILYKDAWTWEVVSIGGQDVNGLDLDVPLDADWPKGTAIYPLRQARLQNETELRALSSRVGESVLLWTMVEANEYFAVMPGNLFEGVPVLVDAPNRSSDITVNHTRLAEDRDNNTGIPYRVDPTGRAFQVQSHSYMRHGRQAQSEFRSMLYWLRGRQRAVWIPSYNEDFVTSRAALNGALNLDIQKIGMSYAGSGEIIPGRDVIRVNGVSARVTALGAPQSPQEERLRIGAGLGAAVPAGRRGSFMAPARLNQDAVEIQHHTDTDGTMECSVTWKTFNNSRDASGTSYIGIPVANMRAGGCGDDFVLVNPGFEFGTGSGWTGSVQAVESPLEAPPHSGSYSAWPGNNSVSEFYQELNIPSKLWAHVDSGTSILSGFGGWHRKLNIQDDHGRLFAEFRNGAGGLISRVDGADDYSNDWALLILPETIIPIGSRRIRVGTRNTRQQGTSNDNYWDDFISPSIL